MSNKPLESSFRDPSGFIFLKDGTLYRQINKSYAHNYEMLMKSGLYTELVEKGLLISHKEVGMSGATDEAYKVVEPRLIPFISYPYEWSFSMLKDAALTTLEIQKISLKYGMTLKDASAYNIQFNDAKPIFIDTLSFEKYQDNTPWVAYQQFCKHFLAPLALMALVNIELGKLSRLYIDGIPLHLTSKLLPTKTKLNFGLLLHIHMHAQSQQKYSDKGKASKNSLSKTGLLGIIDSLQTTIQNLNWKLPKTEWGEYYSFTNYSEKAMTEKEAVVESLIVNTKARTVWDLGANTGRFSRLASDKGINTVAFDIDPVAVELNYLDCRDNKRTHLLPLIQDLTNPTPSIGFSNKERDSLIDRGPVDTVLALALIHHLAISNNLPFNQIAEFFSKCCEFLIIEFVPKSDSQVQKLLSSREDVFTKYNIDEFKTSFGKFFTIEKEEKVSGTERSLYLMRNRK